MINPYRKYIILAVGMLILILFNISIFQKEGTIENGEIVYFELGPQDPRSLIQGDYMRLDYLLGNMIDVEKSDRRGGRAYMKFTIDENRIARDGALYRGEALQEDERLVRVEGRFNRYDIVPKSFLFQEGHVGRYRNGRYGVFRYKDKDSYILVGLADENLEMIESN